ncbi:hypothetical protein B0H12DRAFT_746961 [Mycena haematopus]|nr:hypothetical protein B0H12DRAFT_746961 [Mycena haematopus]
MRVSTFSFVVTAASVVLAIPAPFRRQTDSSIVCPPVDKKGSALSSKGSFVDEGNEFSQCVYPIAGTCAYFFADGSFSEGSSNCPQGLPQTAATGAGSAPTSVVAAPPPPPTTTAKANTPPPPPPPPPATTPPPAPPVTTQAPAPPPPVTTQSTEAAPVTTSSTEIEVPPTSTLLSTFAPPPTSAPPVAEPPATTPAEAATVTINVNVTASATPTGGSAVPLGAAGTGNTNGAVVRSAGTAVAALPILCVLLSLL